ncbi:MAG TPA: 4-alpha-glucanotransferase [Terriglobia bacterium]|nr:4-alpha-glucanotransferase [Terriglobia bacterium]
MNRQLAELARLYGIQTSYRNMWNERQEAAPEAVLLTLAALGAPIRGMSDVPGALGERRRREQDATMQPVIVAWDGRIPATAKKLPSGARASLVGEDGTERAWPQSRLASGYYTLHIRSGRHHSESLVISAPTRAHFPFERPVWGGFAPTYALASSRSPGAGDLSDFDMFIGWILSHGGRVAATLPLLASFLDEPFDASPYAPVSRLFWNEFYADPERTGEFGSARLDGPLATRTRMNGLIDYRQVMAERRAALESLSRYFFTGGSEQRRAQFEAFCRTTPELDRYAQFRAVVDRRRQGWMQWPDELRNGAINPAEYSQDAYNYHRYAQWIVQEQLGQIASRIHTVDGALYLDLPLGLNSDGYDPWRYPDLFVRSMGTGAPPDLMFTEGQDWGFRPLHPQAMRADRYRYMIAGIRNHLRFARLLRIDHVMGLHRLYWIPNGLKKSEGLYVEYPAEELYAILSLESHKNNAGIVGEDLGTVPPGVRVAMRRHNIQQLYALQYEVVGTGATALRPPPRAAVACLNTHDMPPFRAFLDGRDIPDRIRLGFLDVEKARHERLNRVNQRRALARFLRARKLLGKIGPPSMDLFQASTRFLGESRASIALVNVEDLWQETDPQNVPATNHERPNWKRRLKRALEDIRTNLQFAAILRDLDSARNPGRRVRRAAH